MKNIILLLIALSPATNFLLGQSAVEVLRTNAVDLGNLDTLSEEVYQVIKPFDVIMIGEMHGTNEPAKFMYSLAQKIVEKEGKVCVGIEIPNNKINLQQNAITDQSLLETLFFRQENVDGRNGNAWYNLVLNIASNNKMKIFFIDNDTTASQNLRDSVMYLEVRQIKTHNQGCKIITLTGNIHNWLIPFRGSRKMGNFVFADSILFNSAKIMSINHIYNEGTMLNNSGKGLELKNIEPKKNIYSTTLNFENYLCKTILENQEQYNYFFYTRKVSHSKKITER